ncbi:MAG: hypothetical protein ACP5NO_08760, partial [Thermoplasmata archaeon]
MKRESIVLAIAIMVVLPSAFIFSSTIPVAGYYSPNTGHLNSSSILSFFLRQAGYEIEMVNGRAYPINESGRFNTSEASK